MSALLDEIVDSLGDLDKDELKQLQARLKWMLRGEQSDGEEDWPEDADTFHAALEGVLRQHTSLVLPPVSRLLKNSRTKSFRESCDNCQQFVERVWGRQKKSVRHSLYSLLAWKAIRRIFDADLDASVPFVLNELQYPEVLFDNAFPNYITNKNTDWILNQIIKK